MAQGNFRAALDVILRHEGGYADHPQDPGGATNLGITHKTLAAHRGVAKVTRAEVRALGVDEAAEIYELRYWRPLNCEHLPDGVDLVTFDMGVNAGTGRSARMLQEMLKVEQDGEIGPITIRAVKGADPRDLVRRFSDRRLTYYRSLKHWPTFGRGWTRRTEETRAVAIDMTHGVRRAPLPDRAPEPAAPGRGPVRRSTGILEALRQLIAALLGRIEA